MVAIYSMLVYHFITLQKWYTSYKYKTIIPYYFPIEIARFDDWAIKISCL
jgi:hypothetical protein